MYNATNKTGSGTKLWSVSWYCCTVNAAKSKVFPIKASSPWWAQITVSPCSPRGLTQQWSERREQCVLQVWMVPCVSLERFSTASSDALLTGSREVWGHFSHRKMSTPCFIFNPVGEVVEKSHIDRSFLFNRKSKFVQAQTCLFLKYFPFVLTH